LSKQLREKYKGKVVNALRLFNEHQPNTKFCRTHYAKTLRKMAEDQEISVDFTDEKEHKVTVLINEYCNLKFR